MGTRAIVGRHHADGTYQASHVGLDGYPTVIVPFLAGLVHHTFDGDHDAAVAALLRTHWLALGHQPASVTAAGTLQAPSVGRPANEHLPAATGRIARDLAGDREWAYLFTGDDLVVHRAVSVRLTRKRWKTWATWPVSALPQVPGEELERVQRTGIAEDRDAHEFLSFLTAMRPAGRGRP